MSEFKKVMSGLVQGLEKKIQERFGTQAGYQQVKAVVEGKARKVSIKTMVTDARAVFSGENKPSLLAGRALEDLQATLGNRLALFSTGLEAQSSVTASGMEKMRAILENRATVAVHEVSGEEALLVGRLLAPDGSTPIRGAQVVVRGTGEEAEKIVATAVTDDNGEYAIKLDKAMLEEAPKKVAVLFQSPKGETIATTRALTPVRGKASTVKVGVAADKEKITAPLVQSDEERKEGAVGGISALATDQVELDLLRLRTEGAASSVTAMLEGVRDLFGSK